MPTFVKDLVTDFGGTWANWLTFMGSIGTGNDVTLTIPAGTFDAGFTTLFPGNGGVGAPATMTIIGAGASSTTISNPNGLTGTAGYFHTGDGPQPRLQTATAGDTTITLIDPLRSSEFLVGCYIIIMGLDTQGFGYPPNLSYFEYNYITAIDSINGIISLLDPLRFTYKSNWPVYPVIGPTSDDTGGPATATNIFFGWDMDLTVQDLTIAAPSSPYLQGCRSNLFERVTFTGREFQPSAVKSVIYRDCIMSGTSETELDKSNEYVEFDNVSQPASPSANIVNVQSDSCAMTLVIRDCTGSTFTYSGGIGGANVECYDSTLSQLRCGPFYGFTRSIIANNCTAGALSLSPGPIYDFNIFGSVTINPSTGEITANRAQWTNGVTGFGMTQMVPGTWCQLSQTPNTQGFMGAIGPCFQILDLIDNGATITATTNIHEVDTYGNIAVANGIMGVPCQDIYVTGGSAHLACLSHALAQNRPAGEYYFNTATFNDLSASTGIQASEGGQVGMFGEAVKVEFNVITPYTGTYMTIPSRFQGRTNPTFDDAFIASTNTWTNFSPKVDLSVAGVRTMTVGSTVGAQPTDSMSLTGFPVGLWLSGLNRGTNYFLGFGGEDISGILAESPSVWPVWTLEIITATGINLAAESSSAGTGDNRVQSITMPTYSVAKGRMLGY